MYDPTWLFRGAQSALFYYVSCAPCTKITSTRKRRKQIERDRRAREAQEAHSPVLYRQPSPYRTNQYWNEEISLGPGPPPKRASKKQRNARAKLAKTGGAESPAPDVEDGAGESSTLETVKQKIQEAGELWNNKRYQREDEELWGSNITSKKGLQGGHTAQDTDASSSRGIRRYPGQSEGTRASKETFYTAKVPPLNDLHPPVVSNPLPNWHSNRWMLQPPPSASVMAGYENARSRSNSGTSSRKGADIPLSKQMGEKIIEKKFQNGHPASTIRSLPKARLPDGEGQNHQRNIGPQSRAASYWTAQNLSEESTYTNATIIRKDPLATDKSPASADSGIGDLEDLPNDLDLDFAMPRSPPKAVLKKPKIITNDSSLHILQELVTPTTLLSSKYVSDAAKEAMIRLPASDSQDELELVGQIHNTAKSPRPVWEDDYHRWDLPGSRARWSY